MIKKAIGYFLVGLAILGGLIQILFTFILVMKSLNHMGSEYQIGRTVGQLFGWSLNLGVNLMF